MKNVQLKKMAVALLVAMGVSVAFAKETLVAEYIVPTTEIDNWNSPNKIFQGYNTPDKKGFTFTRRGPIDGYYNYYLPELGTNYNAIGYWINSSNTKATFPEFYTRSVVSQRSPSHRYFYKLRLEESKYPGIFYVDASPTMSILAYEGEGVIPSTNLEATVILEKIDNSATDYGDGTKAPYVQCVHTDYVYTVTFKANGGGGADYTQGNITNSANLVANRFSRTGYSFFEWNTQADGKGTECYDDGDKIEPTDDLALYAQWTGNVYTVKFNANGGNISSGSSSQEVTFGGKYKEPPSASRTGFTHTGWYTEKTGGVEKYAGSIVDIPSNHVLYAHYTLNDYNLNIKLGTGIASVCYQIDEGDWKSVTTDSAIPIAYNSEWMAYGVAKEGYISKTSQENPKSGTMGMAGDTFNATATAKTYTVTSKGENCSVKVASSGTFGKALSVSWTPDFEVGYSFTKSSANVYAGSSSAGELLAKLSGETLDTFTMSGTYYEQIHVEVVYLKDAKAYTVTLDQQGGIGGTESVTATYAKELPSITAPTRDGYTFGGYFSKPNGTGSQYYNADGKGLLNWDVDANTTLYAKWSLNVYALTFDAQGGVFTNGLDKLTIRDRYVDGWPYGEFPVVSNVSDKVSFAGWWDTNDVAIATQQLTTSCASPKLKTLYARWKTNEVETLVKITFDANGGTGGVTTNCVKGLEIGDALPSDPTRDGYRFVGWYEQKEVGARITKDTIVNGAATYYARWSDKAIEDVLGSFDGVAFQIAADTVRWYEDTSKTYEGQRTLRSGETPGNDFHSTLNAFFASEGGGKLSFVWSMQGDKYDGTFNTGAFKNKAKSGTHDWTSASVDSKEKYRTDFWQYTGDKDTPPTSCAWISNFSWKPNPVISPIADWTNNLASANLVFETGGAKPWTNAVPLSEGIRTQKLADGEFSWVRTTAKGLGALSFRWRTDCERGYVDEKTGDCRQTDRLEFRVDGQTTPFVIDGSNAWTTVSFTQTVGGAHVYEWRYVKDADTSVGEDCAWLDDVIWQPVLGGVLFLIQ